MSSLEKDKNQKMSKKNIVIGVSCLAVLAVIYIAGSIFFQEHYLPRTVINGVACTGKTVQRVQEDIKNGVENYELTIREREDKSEIIAGKDIEISVEFDDTLGNILEKQNGWKWVVTLFRPEVFESKSIVSYDEAALKKQMNGLKCMDKKQMTAPVDATLKKEGQSYVIAPEVPGTTVDEEAFWKKLNTSVLNLQYELSMDKEKCYVEPAVSEDSKILKKTLAQLKDLEKAKITYTFGEQEEVLEGSDICNWMQIKKGKAVLDEEKALEYVKSLGSKYNTAYRPKQLKTSWGSTVTISGGDYGWKIDNEGEIQQLKEDAAQAKDVTREPVYAQTANSHGENDYGDTYVEINLTAQHLYFYKNGNLVIESDFVSGNPSRGNATPLGAYQVTYTERNAILRGENYATKVSFWMPYCGDVGLHDASWRGSFGGGIYKRNGSHGCINLPYSVAGTIFENIAAGYPVLVYELPGTESTKAIAMEQADAMIDAINMIGVVTPESQGIIAACRGQYDMLSEEAKSYVSNYDVLLAAEAAYVDILNQQAAQVQAQEAQGQANVVIDLINQIGGVTPESGGAIKKARDAYNALSDLAKSFVVNYGVLISAEEEYKSLTES